ncbi:hypothetical protein JWV37_12355 [Sulfurospirillum sp. T05]|uniref:O-antigen ligase domain-containing protein n=1 Tax=Sulfurospirillum tamanense TaxID=2813362 RepID=A0ABS2WVA6_9BACT|nr:hypothetical protein [Sulfurospirillum tamanensis]MBN2965575.1 hypothetical protein [Sulfurospirillum tamanensis]
MRYLAKINLSSICFSLVCLGLFVFPISYELVPSVRLLDVVLLVLLPLFIFSNPKLDKSQLLIVFVVAAIFFLSSFFSLLSGASFEFSRVGFIYKYILIFTVPWILVSIVETKRQVSAVNWLLLIGFIFLSSWTYMYSFLLRSDVIDGSLRPSFPFSSDYMESDAHLYSSYLGFFTVAYLFYLRKYFNHSMIISFLILSNAMAGLLLTGSRTGLLLVGLSILLYSFYFIFKFFNSKKTLITEKKILIYFVLFLLLLFFLTTFFMPFVDTFLSGNQWLIQRALNFDLVNDQSSQGRIYKLMVGISDAEYSGLLLGAGLNSSLVWYDGLFSILLAHGGLLFVFFIFLFYYLIVKKASNGAIRQKDFSLFLLLVVLYLIANIITEYVFVSRNAFPVLVMLSVLYLSISEPRLNTVSKNKIKKDNS